MACENSGFGDCSDCGPPSACCELDASGVIVLWSGCGGPLPNIRGWVNDPANPGQFIIKSWTAPGKTFTKFTYSVTNTQCDPAPGVMEWWEVANWALGTSRTFVRDSATNLRLCCGSQCLPQGHPANTLISLNPIGSATGTPGGYDGSGNPTTSNDDCQGPLITGILSGFTPSQETIIFHSENHITVKHPCRITDHGVGSLEYCTVDIVAQEYTPAMHKGIVDAELLDAVYPAYSMMRTISHPSPCSRDSVDEAQVAWPADHMHCEQPSPFILGIDSTIAGKVLIRKSEPGLCNPLPGNTGPTADLQIIKRLGDTGNIYVADCFNCGERPANVISPP